MVGMRKRAAGIAVCLLLLPGMEAQRSGSTTLVLQVSPEARVEPAAASLRFEVSAAGSSAQAATVTAWVRAAAGVPIRLQARLTGLTGPDGTVAGSALAWSGAAGQATGGGRQANCIGGNFANAGAQDLVQGWTQSGMLQCAVTLQLVQSGTLAPGLYTGTVEFSAAGN